MTDETKIANLTGLEMEAISAEFMPARITEIMGRIGYVSTTQSGVPGRLYKDGRFVPYKNPQAVADK